MAEIDLQEMYRHYAQPVYRYLFSLCKNSATAEDLTSETFCRALKSISRYDESCKLQTWLFQIAKHVWYQFLGNDKHCRVIEIPETVPSGDNIESAYEEQAQRMELYRRIQRLDAPVREVFYLRLAGELSFAEIGQILGKSANWARTAYYRGKERMKANE